MSNFEAPAVAEEHYQPVEMAESSRLQDLVESGKLLVGRAALALCLATGLAVGEAAIDAQPAMAATGGYPDWEAPCVANNNNVKQGTGYWCSDYQWGYYTRNAAGAIIGNVQNSSRGYGYRNCTDWVAWRIPELVQKSVPVGWGNAKNWDDKATAAGYTVDNTPEPGDIAVWEGGTYGHVEVVESVNSNGTANTSGYNKHRDGNYDTQSGVTADHYIDLNGSGKGINGEDLTGGSSTASGRTPDSDFDGHDDADLALTALRGDGTADMLVLPTTREAFGDPQNWRTLDGYGWNGITPLVADVTGDKLADYVFLTNEGANGVKLFVARSTGNGTLPPELWWNGTGYGYDGIKASIGDLDKNGRADVVMTTREGNGTAAAMVLKSTGISFMAPEKWRTLDAFGWDGIKPLVGDVNGDKYADYIFLTNEGANGTKAFVSLSTSTGLQAPALWWNGSGYGWDGIKPALGDMDNNGAEDLVLTAKRGDGTADALVLLSTWQWFMNPGNWRTLDAFGWDGITPLVGDVNGDDKDDYVFLTNEHENGTRAFVALSTGNGTQAPALWWNGTGYGYDGIKPSLG